MPSAMGVSGPLTVHQVRIWNNSTTVEESTPAQESSSSSPSAIILRDQDGTISTLRDSAAGMLHSILQICPAELLPYEGEFLQSRTFRGLETRAGLDPPSVLQQGRSGIARGYEDDH